MSLLLPLLLACAPRDPAPPPVADDVDVDVPLPAAAPNVLIVVADDVGTDMIAAYGEHEGAPPTPAIDGLAAEGVLFRAAWATPTCSPSRATLMTGRYPTRTGIGDTLRSWQKAPDLALSEVTLAEALRASPTPYATMAVGKWHLASATGGLTHPNDQGFDHFLGSMSNFGDAVPRTWQTHTDWIEVIDGVQQPERVHTWADTVAVDDVVARLPALREPWLIYVALHAAHGPYQAPPDDLNPDHVTDADDDRAKYRAEVRAVDASVARLLDALGDARARTLVIVLGDNGTPGEVASAGIAADQAKNTMYEAGVNVPLVVAGPGVAHGESRALVSVADVLPTLAAAARVPASALPELDGQSLWPHLVDPAAPDRRGLVFSEHFSPNGVDRWRKYLTRAVRDPSFKLIRRQGKPDELYDLRGVDREGVDLLGAGDLGPEAAAAYERLDAALDAKVAEMAP